MRFPWRKYSKKELLDEYEKLSKKLKTMIVDINKLNLSKIGMKCSNFFFQYERLKTPSQNKISCFDFWRKDEDKIIQYYNKNERHSNDLFATIVFMNHPSSQFSPLIAGQIYKYFDAKNILDPYCGWGDRALAAIALDINYTGIDSNNRLKPYYDKMIEYYPYKSNIEIIYDYCENIDINKIFFDIIFTSPPYWDEKSVLLEKYNNCENNYNAFMKKSLLPLINKALKKKNVWICINIPKFMYDDIAKQIRKCDKIIKFKTNINNKSLNHGKHKLNNIYCFSSYTTN